MNMFLCRAEKYQNWGKNKQQARTLNIEHKK